MTDEERRYRRRLFDQFAIEAMKAFIGRQDTLEVIRQTKGHGMSMAVLIAGTSWEMARQMMKHRSRVVPDDDEGGEPLGGDD